ncbi:MAG TPA: cytochrome P450 [Microthrixaceae bacterium]|nr:cytochrome P450 [Microthrixaceae bacterium]
MGSNPITSTAKDKDLGPRVEVLPRRSVVGAAGDGGTVVTTTDQHAGIDLLAGDFWGGDFHPALTWMREHDPLHWDGRVWGVASYDLVKEVSRQPERFSNAQGCRPDQPFPMPMMIDTDDPEHIRRRKLVNRGFTPRQVRGSEPAVRAACDEIIDSVIERGECDFVTDVAAWLPMIMIGDALGVAPEDRARLLEWSDDLVRGLVGSEGDALDRATASYVEFRAFAEDAIARRRAEPTDDLMSVLVHAEVDGERLDDESIIHESLLILIGGDETTRHVITGGMYQLLVDPDQRRLLADDPSLIPTAVEEMLRWVSPIRNMNRTVVADTELAGKQLRAGDKLLLLYPSANRDASVFDDPFTFDATREPNDHVAFGFGTHFCLGNSLARLELVCMFEHLLERMPDMELVDPTEPRNRPANFVSGYESMPVRFTPGRRRRSG